jgi:hypothetical protein
MIHPAGLDDGEIVETFSLGAPPSEGGVGCRVHQYGFDVLPGGMEWTLLQSR